ncbi:MAG: cupredoxin domain-containing protein [Alphaproteobacteria bacterium]|nr:cupredoxin domain-containing protein [Alphaproteobacteria bacterium]MBP7758188.1 cupredoxin domain-containing protein [Alphaproteobacteria bacterium]MBP7761379.1 cupredoxin domain-containing protein [Alphaproteobacteria bacterium]MBP7906187.1 cupredoxin domain-containing protein [Alphaproteobacteria bacterium]
MKYLNILGFVAAVALVPAFSVPAFSVSAFAVTEITVVIKDHKFEPSTVEIPAGEKVKLIVDNQDATPEEFESHELNREKVIRGNSKGIVLIGPLKEGTYPFFGEFNPATAQGQIIAKAPGSESPAPASGEGVNAVEASSGEGAVPSDSAPTPENPAAQ